MGNGKMKIIVTLGPSTHSADKVQAIKERGVTFVRTNMSHSTIEDLEYFINLAKKYNIPFLLDTQGPQVRTGKFSLEPVHIKENDEVEIHRNSVPGDEKKFSLWPGEVILHLKEGDLIHFDGLLTLRVTDTQDISKKGYVRAYALTNGYIKGNKGVAIDSMHPSSYILPTLSEIDYKSIGVGLSNGVSAVAASFMRNATDVHTVKEATKGKMLVFSKIECQEALRNLDEIINASDMLIIDRHDLSKEIPREKLLSTQKMIIDRARSRGKDVFCASYILESMVTERTPSQHDVYGVLSAIECGAQGFALSTETTIGKYPIAAIDVLKELIEKSHQKITAKNTIL